MRQQYKYYQPSLFNIISHHHNTLGQQCNTTSQRFNTPASHPAACTPAECKPSTVVAQLAAMARGGRAGVAAAFALNTPSNQARFGGEVPSTLYRGASPIRNTPLPEPYRRTIPRGIWWS